MEKQVLTISQMNELNELGIDISDASMCWVATGRADYTNELSQIREMTLQTFTDIRKDIWLNKETFRRDDIIPTFTLQDILEKLPKNILVTDEYTEKSEYLSINRLRIGCPEGSNDLYIMYTKDGKMNGGWAVFNAESSLLNASFLMLKFVKQNGYI